CHDSVHRSILSVTTTVRRSVGIRSRARRSGSASAVGTSHRLSLAGRTPVAALLRRGAIVPSGDGWIKFGALEPGVLAQSLGAIGFFPRERREALAFLDLLAADEFLPLVGRLCRLAPEMTVRGGRPVHRVHEVQHL